MCYTICALYTILSFHPISHPYLSIDGFISVNQQLRLAIFTQHHLDSFDLSLSPLQNMMKRWPLAPEVRD